MSGAEVPQRSGFHFGVATDGYSVEGGYNGPGQPSNNWVGWERTGRVAWPGPPGTFFERPEPVLDRVAGLGCDTFALSVEWSRVEPEPDGVDDGALDRYAAILAACAERGLEPIVALHHFTHPWWLGTEFWLTPGSPDRFAAHAARVVARLGAHCRTWVPVVEPARLAERGWVSGRFPPGRRLAVSDAYAVLDNLLTAHVLAARAIRGAQPGAEVVCRAQAGAVYERGPLALDLLAARGPADDDPTGPLDQRIEERRRAFARRYPWRRVGEAARRGLSGALSPYGRPAGSLGRTLQRPSPRRIDGLVGPGSDPAPDALWLGWDGSTAELPPASIGREAARLAPASLRYTSGDLRHAGLALDAVRSGVPLGGFLLQSGIVAGSGRFGSVPGGGGADSGDAYGRLVAAAAPGGPAASGTPAG